MFFDRRTSFTHMFHLMGLFVSQRFVCFFFGKKKRSLVVPSRFLLRLLNHEGGQVRYNAIRKNKKRSHAPNIWEGESLVGDSP